MWYADVHQQDDVMMENCMRLAGRKSDAHKRCCDTYKLAHAILVWYAEAYSIQAT